MKKKTKKWLVWGGLAAGLVYLISRGQKEEAVKKAVAEAQVKEQKEQGSYFAPVG